MATAAIAGIHAKAKGGIVRRLCSGVIIEDFSDGSRHKRSPGQIPNKFRPSFDDELTGGGQTKMSCVSCSTFGFETKGEKLFCFVIPFNYFKLADEFKKVAILYMVLKNKGLIRNSDVIPMLNENVF